MTSDRELTCMCVSWNWLKLQSNYLLGYFYGSHFDDVPFVTVSSAVFWFVLVYVCLPHIRL